MKKRKPKIGPSAHGAIAPAKYTEGKEWPYDAVIIPGTHDEGVHLYDEKQIREMANWLIGVADYISEKANEQAPQAAPGDGERAAEKYAKANWPPDLEESKEERLKNEACIFASRSGYLAGFQARAHLVELLKEVLNSDMAMREEDEGRESKLLWKIRAALQVKT